MLLQARSLIEVLLRSVALGGDGDTVAAIATAAAVSPAMARNLPSALIARLEAGEHGRPWLEALDRRLAAAFGLPLVAAAPRRV